MSWRRASSLVVVLWALVLALPACGPGQEGVAAGASETVRGVVLAVEAKSLTEIDTLTVADEAGVTWHFEAGDYKGFPPSHLREHMVQGSPVSVTFRREEGVLIIEGVTD